jgi:hypothetical protein
MIAYPVRFAARRISLSNFIEASVYPNGRGAQRSGKETPSVIDRTPFREIRTSVQKARSAWDQHCATMVAPFAGTRHRSRIRSIMARKAAGTRLDQARSAGQAELVARRRPYAQRLRRREFPDRRCCALLSCFLLLSRRDKFATDVPLEIQV